MTGVQQTQIVFNNISIISSKFFFLALHICQRQSLSKFFLKIHRVSKVRFMRFYYLKTELSLTYMECFEKKLDDIIQMLLNTICVCCTPVMLKDITYNSLPNQNNRSLPLLEPLLPIVVRKLCKYVHGSYYNFFSESKKAAK